MAKAMKIPTTNAAPLANIITAQAADAIKAQTMAALVR